jgi:hypothetical protein
LNNPAAMLARIRSDAVVLKGSLTRSRFNEPPGDDGCSGYAQGTSACPSSQALPGSAHGLTMGGPKGARNRISEKFLADLFGHYDENGLEAIKAVFLASGGTSCRRYSTPYHSDTKRASKRPLKNYSSTICQLQTLRCRAYFRC